MDYYYAKAYMTERLQEAEEARLADSIRRQPNEPSLLTRLVEQLPGRLLWPIGSTRAVLGATPVTIDADCCAACA